MLVPAIILAMFVGSELGVIEARYQPMKIAAAEAQWTTCQPCSFSLFQIGGGNNDHTPTQILAIPHLLSLLATNSWNGKVTGLSPLQSQYTRQFGPGNYVPDVFIQYWSMRIMAYTAGLEFLLGLWGLWLIRRRTLASSRWFLKLAVWAVILPFLMNTAGWLLTESGRQPWIVQGHHAHEERGVAVRRPGQRDYQPDGFRCGVCNPHHRGRGTDDPLRAEGSRAAARSRGRGGRPGHRGPVLGAGGQRMTLVQFWFIVIALLWTGFFVLEGFDFGVGMLHTVAGRGEAGSRAAVNTIGPLWDGNEVWLIVAGAAMFAAFPDWYATMFSGFYLALVVLLLALIVRGISFEYRGKSASPRWHATWDIPMIAGSLVAPLLIGVALGDLLHGLPIDKAREFTGNFFTLLQPYGLYAGVTLVALCLLHGATFLALKTTGDLRESAGMIARLVAPPAALLVAGFAIWTHITGGKGVLPNPVEIVAILAAAAAVWLVSAHREGWAFAATTVAMATSVLSIFTELYPRVMVSSTSPAYSLTIPNAASGSYALKVMTIVVVIFFPLVLLYQGWTYYVFRQRLSPGDFRPPALLTRPGPRLAGSQRPRRRRPGRAGRDGLGWRRTFTPARRCPRAPPALQ